MPVCNICFDEVKQHELYAMPCDCQFNSCWACLHIQYETNPKASLCPCCRGPTRYHIRSGIIETNNKIVKKEHRRGLVYRCDLDLINNRPDEREEQELKFLEDIIICINFIRSLDTSSQCRRSLLGHPNMKGPALPIWAKSKGKLPHPRNWLRWQK